MSHEIAMHDRRLSAHRAMGARARTRCDAKAAQPNTAGFTNTTPDRRASFRYPQSVDGSDALLDQDIASREYRDEFASTRLQHKPSNAHPPTPPPLAGTPT